MRLSSTAIAGGQSAPGGILQYRFKNNLGRCACPYMYMDLCMYMCPVCVCVSTCRMYLYIYIYRTIGINHKNIMMHIYTIRIIICVFYTKCTFYCTVQSSLHRSPCLPGNGRIASMSFFWWPPVHIITFGPSLDWVIWIVCLVFQSIRLISFSIASTSSADTGFCSGCWV